MLVVCCVGCGDDILDPTQTGRFRPVPVINVILESLGVADEPDPTYADTEEPRADDLIDYERDYVFGAGDVVRISIYELRREGIPFIYDYIVTESGRISIPDVGQVLAAGLTEVKLEEEIKDILSPGILKDPFVTVLLLRSESLIFSIYGRGVGRSGRFPIPRYTFRLTDAVALAGDVGQWNVSYIYISRDVPVVEEAPQPQVDSAPMYPEQPTGEKQSAAPLDVRQEEDAIAEADRGATVDDDIAVTTDTGRAGWVFEDGKWVPTRIDGYMPETPPTLAGTEPAPQIGPDALTLQEPAAGEYGLGQVGRGAVETRVIKIPVESLKSGDPRYDIIIRPGDRISVPVDIIGEFWVMGNVNRRGVIDLTGRPMTLKMAIATAGGLGPLAWPKKVEVVRRIGRNKAGLLQEETVMVDLDKIATGQQPDFFIKPFDLVNVGTHGTSRWLAVLRNAFRATYGFGFIYDRNFAARDFGNDPFPGHVSFDSMF